MKASVTLIFLLYTLSAFAQISGTVLDKETQEPVPFVNIWVENENIGTMTNYQGVFVINEAILSKQLVLSSLGYENLKIQINRNNLTLYLTPKTYQLNEVVASAAKKTKELKIGDKVNRWINSYNNHGNCIPWIAAKYISYDESYLETPFIKSVSLITESSCNESILGLRLLTVDELTGKPNYDVLKERIFIYPKAGRRITTIDLSEYQIILPQTGIFIAIESLEFDCNFTPNDTEQIKTSKCSPLYGCIWEETNQNAWLYLYGRWQKPDANHSSAPKFNGKYQNLAVELLLTN